MAGKQLRAMSGKKGVGMSAPGRPKAVSVPVQAPGAKLHAASVKPPKNMAPIITAPKLKKAY